jgi:uncharacterized protein YwqG
MKFFDLFRKKKVAGPGVNNAAGRKTLTPEQAAYRSQVKASALPSVHIEASPAGNLFLFDSKFGGLPYWPVSRPYPTGSDGKPLFLLAQLNFSQIPSLEGYPDKGLLQFYVAANDLYGADFDNPTDQKDFRVVYWDDLQQMPVEDFRFLTAQPRDSAVPVAEEMQLRFSLQTDYVSYEDVRYELFVKDDLPVSNPSPEGQSAEEDAFLDDVDNGGHKIGGYAFFTQNDPRNMDSEYANWILLLQIDSQDNSILWGDVGVGNFFIHPDALARKDFSNVLYNWDCS